jgi:serine/threonine protein kinase
MADRELEAGLAIGDFVIESRLGSGGMGVVYRARQKSLGRTVALKVLGHALTRGTDIARFRREAQAAAKLEHPNIARLYFVGQDGDVCYMAMEYVEGTTLRSILESLATDTGPFGKIDDVVTAERDEGNRTREIRFDEPDVGDGVAAVQEAAAPLTEKAAARIRTEEHIHRCCKIVMEAALALDYAHRRGVIHLDVKPDNIMLDRQGHVRIIDFGVARFFEDVTVTQTGQLVGTPIYMSPEQVAGKFKVDQRTDIYSLGIVLYELLTLLPPFLASTREALLRQILTKLPVPLDWRNAAVSSLLRDVVHKAAGKDPDARYKSGEEFVEDLQRALDGKAVTAPTYRFKMDETEIAASRPTGVVVLAVVYLAAGIIIAFFLVMTLLRDALVLVFTDRGTAEAMLFAYSVETVMSVAGCISTLVAGTGMLYGRRWARVTALAVAGATFLGSLYYVVLGGIKLAQHRIGPNVFSLIEIMLAFTLPLFAVSISCLWVLCTRRTREWFRLAARLRAEFAQERKQATRRERNAGRRDR